MTAVGMNRPNEDVRIQGSFRRDNGRALVGDKTTL
jgi:hypothetical protein